MTQTISMNATDRLEIGFGLKFFERTGPAPGIRNKIGGHTENGCDCVLGIPVVHQQIGHAILQKRLDLLFPKSYKLKQEQDHGIYRVELIFPIDND